MRAAGSMRIETAATSGSPTKVKGDLLEDLAVKLLRTQNCEVTTQIRVTASELDLLCEHRVTRKSIYVECKAYRDNVDANILKNLLGTVVHKNYQEGWLISAGPLGKDAKGFQHEHEHKVVEERQRMSIYTPDRAIEALVNSGTIKAAPQEKALATLGSPDSVGEWTLLVTEFGTVWAVTCLQAGVPVGVLAFSAATAQLIDDIQHLRNLASTDTTLNTLDFEYVIRFKTEEPPAPAVPGFERVVEVQHGESWTDYRPARPEDFVGRKESQLAITKFLRAVRSRETDTRVFAVTGDSGMGKSSLIAKLRQRVSNIRNRRNFFLYAVDVRAATGPPYILWSLLACLRKASAKGFGSRISEPVRVSDYCEPLASPSISEFLATLEEQNQVVCLVFDQFEELYSKPELFPVFEEAQRLFLSAASAGSSLVLGFAWRTDSTVQQGHPSYFMWHRLADHRFEIGLAPFSHVEASMALTLFEKALGEKIRPELRRKIIENSQGYPWLLKKLSIHLYEQIQSGISQADLTETLDVASLFDRDLKILTAAENACIRQIAQGAPADWYETLEAFGPEVLRALQDKRLIVRSGDRLNLYWDIFREYVLTKTVPSIPFGYLPSSPSLTSLLSVAGQLRDEENRSPSELSGESGLSEKTVGNVIRDLVMFGVATGGGDGARLDPAMPSSSPKDVLEQIRHVLKRHALTLKLMRFDEKSQITLDDIIKYLKQLNPTAKHRVETWVGYAERMAIWLTATGFLEPSGSSWIARDKGEVSLPTHRSRRRRGDVFTGGAPPIKVVEAYEWLKANEPATGEAVEEAGFRNAFAILVRFELASRDDEKRYRVAAHPYRDAAEAVWNAAREEETISDVIEYLMESPARRGTQLARYLNDKYKANWSAGSEKRFGDALLSWGKWVMLGTARNMVPPPPGRRTQKDSEGPVQYPLFDS
jgi:hypothetical protein